MEPLRQEFIKELVLLGTGAVMATIYPVFQSICGRRESWRQKKEECILNIEEMYEASLRLAQNPNYYNHQLFQHELFKCRDLLQLKGEKFRTKKIVIEKISSKIESTYFRIILDSEYEEMLNISGLSSKCYPKFVNMIGAIVTFSLKEFIES